MHCIRFTAALLLVIAMWLGLHLLFNYTDLHNTLAWQNVPSGILYQDWFLGGLTFISGRFGMSLSCVCICIFGLMLIMLRECHNRKVKSFFYVCLCLNLGLFVTKLALYSFAAPALPHTALQALPSAQAQVQAQAKVQTQSKAQAQALSHLTPAYALPAQAIVVQTTSVQATAQSTAASAKTASAQAQPLTSQAQAVPAQPLPLSTQDTVLSAQSTVLTAQTTALAAHPDLAAMGSSDTGYSKELALGQLCHTLGQACMYKPTADIGHKKHKPGLQI